MTKTPSVVGMLAAVVLLLLVPVTLGREQNTVFLPAVQRGALIPGFTISGIVFFDYNGNGPRDGGEPPIEGILIEVGELSTTSGADGRYAIVGLAYGSHQVRVQSPTDDPATAFRYINRFLGWVDIPAHEIGGVQVPAQHLPDTEIQPIEEPLSVALGGDEKLDIGLMQGFLTLPFVEPQTPNPFIFNYFDIIGLRCFNGGFTYDDSRDGVMLNYDGQYDEIGDPFPHVVGVGDSHNGLDFPVPVSTFVVSASPTSQVFHLAVHDDGQLLVHTMFPDPERLGLMYKNAYGHLGAQLVELDQIAYRGQIIALSGDTGANNIFPGYGSRRVPQLHFDLSRTTAERATCYIDPFRCEIELDPVPDNFWGSEISYWIVDNQPTFSR